MLKIVLRLLVLAVVVAIGYYLYSLGEKPSEARPFAPYRLDELATTPLPKQVFLDGVQLYANGICKDEKFLAIIKSEQAACLAHVEQAHARCLAEIASALPEKLTSKDEVGQFSKQYVGCATPKG